ncbi:hypothetical protein [Streptomyces sp. NPDC005125]
MDRRTARLRAVRRFLFTDRDERRLLVQCGVGRDPGPLERVIALCELFGLEGQ